MSLGPVIRNVLAGQHFEPLKDNLAIRLEQAEERDNGLGAVIERGGKLVFIPNYAGDSPVPKLTPYREPAYIPFQGENAYLNPDPKERVLDAVHQLVNPSTPAWDPLTEPLSVGDIVEFICGNKMDGRYVGARGVVTGIDTNRLAPDETLVMCKWEQAPSGFTPNGEGFYRRRMKLVSKAGEEAPKLQVVKSMFGFTIGQAVMKVGGTCNLGQVGKVTMFDVAGEYVSTNERVQVSFNNGADVFFTKPEYLQAATPKIDPMKEPLKVGDRVLQTKTDTVNYDVEAVVDRIESDGTLVLKWDRNPHGDNGRWGNTLRDCFRIIERDGVPIC